MSRVFQRSHTAIFEPLDEGGYEALVPAIPEIITYGRTLKEAKEMAMDAIKCHIGGLVKVGEASR
ncbi:MAG TPA: type II toxin-antitoxin system HicB family antitoxin [Candidatus Brocadiales bacterium]|nr:type II toxin-antitoxin system HicB family antitoxin [Candidatus Brocadiales bacterium]